ncbi:MAG: SRPBCC family protein [Usitatibacter sp.]
MKKLAAITACAAAPLAFAAERAIEKEIVVNAPVHAAWSAWATSEGIQSFFAPEAIVEARPEGRYSIHFNPYGAPGMRGADDMRVLAVQPDRMISFTWNAPPHLPEARAQRTLVIVRTEPVGEQQTRVKITHVGWGDGGQWDEAYKYFDAAWPRVLASLEKRFTDGPVDWAPRLQQLKK